MKKEAHIREINHTGITVSDLERSVVFWRDVLGFELSHTAEQSGDMAEQITGIPGAALKLAVLKGPAQRIELLQYQAPVDRKKLNGRPCDVGFMHVALSVNGLEALLERMREHGWIAAGIPQTLMMGPNAGKRVVYVRDSDGVTIELMEQNPQQP
jgi:catechol 2,3-dioxygenase-like lactoylglutathione lyase family enzyme